MGFLIDLWLPILLATIALWLSSFIAWVPLQHHFGDFGKVGDEDEVMRALKSVPSGNYMIPYAGSNKVQNSKEYMERYTAGPRATLNVYDMPNMGANMAQTILYFLVTALTIAYITYLACPPGEESTTFMRVFRVAGTIGVLNYGSSGVLNRIWFKAKMWTNIVDGVVYGLLLGLIFAALWP